MVFGSHATQAPLAHPFAGEETILEIRAAEPVCLRQLRKACAFSFNGATWLNQKKMLWKQVRRAPVFRGSSNDRIVGESSEPKAALLVPSHSGMLPVIFELLLLLLLRAKRSEQNPMHHFCRPPDLK